jgi:hypothetical protein
MYRGRAITWRASAGIARDGVFPLAEVLRANLPELNNRSECIWIEGKTPDSQRLDCEQNRSVHIP